MFKNIALILATIVLAISPALAQDWPSVPYVSHATLQAVNSDGSPAYVGGFPIRMVGVVLNNTEDWLDPTPDYDPGVTLWYMGGQAEIFVQTLWESTMPALGEELYNPYDFGGTACWIGQNYGNHIMNQDPYFSYTNQEWTAELGRLNFFGGDNVTDPIRAGDLVEIRARAGLHYQGKYNINEQHSKDPAKDFEVVRLMAGYGLPEATPLFLNDLKYANDTFIFDHTRQTGGERYQSTRVRISDVHITAPQDWTPGSNLTITDGIRHLSVRLALDPDFDGTPPVDLYEPFDLVGILNQSSTHGVYATDGYYLMVMSATDIISHTSTATLSGIIELQAYIGDITSVPVTIEIRNPGSTTALETHVVSLTSDGGYSLETQLPGIYDIAAKGPTWLRQVQPAIDTADNPAVHFSLLNGDCDGNNSIGFNDINIVIDSFGAIEGDAGWDPRADLDGNGSVGFDDINIVVNNFGYIGDE